MRLVAHDDDVDLPRRPLITITAELSYLVQHTHMPVHKAFIQIHTLTLAPFVTHTHTQRHQRELNWRTGDEL